MTSVITDEYLNIPQDYKSVIQRGNGVCTGFANLFSHFCKLVHIPEYQVNGYAKGAFTSDSDDPNKSNHVWNLAKADKYWYIVDVTWDSSSITNGRLNRYYSNKCLFTPPEQFITTHFPINSDCQLLTPPVKVNDFINMPRKD